MYSSAYYTRKSLLCVCRIHELRKLYRHSELQTVYEMSRYTHVHIIILIPLLSGCTYIVHVYTCTLAFTFSIVLNTIYVQFSPQFHEHYFAACFDSGSLQVNLFQCLYEKAHMTCSIAAGMDSTCVQKVPV